MYEKSNSSPIQEYEKSVSDFEIRQGKDAKEINMTMKSKNGLVDELKSRFKTPNNKNVIGHSKLENKVRWISTERVCVGVAIVMMIAIGSFSWGISNNEQAEKNLAETNRQMSKSKSAVHGNHLTNIPKDYSDWAAGASVKKQEVVKKQEIDDLELSNNTVVEDVPVIPNEKNVVVYDTYADRNHQYEEDLKLKAKESPIAFDIKEDK
mgnify:CR=1 FL=1